MFEDESFSPSSMLSYPSKPSLLTGLLSKNIQFRQVQLSESNQIELLGYCPNIYLGNSVNASLFSVISSLNQFPSRLSKIFCTTEVNYKGEYVLIAYHNGIPTSYKLDSWFPYYNSQIAFIRTDNLQAPQRLWPIFIEKLWAKMYGGYFKGNNKHPHVVLSELTGAPCRVLALEGNDVEASLRDWLKNGYLVLAEVKAQNGFDGLNVMGLVKEIKGNEVSVLMPSGFSLPNTEPNPKDSCTRLAISSFLSTFSTLTTCYIHDNYKYSHIESSKSCFEVTISTSGKTFFQITQKRSSELRMIISNSSGYIIGKSIIGSRLFIDLNADPGKYQVYVEHNGKNVFSVYSQMNSGIEEQEDLGFFRNSFNENSLKRNKSTKTIQVIEDVDVLCLERIGEEGGNYLEGFVFCLVINKNLQFKAFVEVLQNSQNFELFGKMEFLIDKGSASFFYLRQIDLEREAGFCSSVRAKMIKV